MPWLISAALLHSAIVVEKRDTLKAWTILLAILAFGFSLIGTFIVRSGVLTSVHAFANDPERGVFILMILAVFFGGALLLFALRAKAMDSKGIFAPVSRESALIANNLLLAISCFVVFVGTVWPLVAELLMDRKLSVGPPFFDLAFTPFMVALAVILPIGSTLPWKRARQAHVTRLWPVALLCLAVVGLVWAMQTGRSLIGPIGVGLGVWLVMGVAIELYQRCGRSAGKARRLLRLPLADWGKAIAHAGLGITILGVAGITAWQVEDIRVLEIGQSAEVAGYTVTLEAVEDRRGPNYLTTMSDVALSQQGKLIAMLHPERRYYPVAKMPTTEAGIDSGLWRDVYVVVGEAQPEGGYAVRSFIKPLANWIWTGAIVMALGGFLSLFDRRYRMAAGAPRDLGREAAAQ
jgi:cytochrome c-type biogenesis protein CcmF